MQLTQGWSAMKVNRRFRMSLWALSVLQGKFLSVWIIFFKYAFNNCSLLVLMTPQNLF
jgi:hypothetical protein